MWRDEAENSTGVQAEGILADTPIATPQGWRAAGDIAPGDEVLTFDSGARVVLQVRKQRFGQGAALLPTGSWPLRIPVGALDNRHEIALLPEQKLLIECDKADALYGDPFVLIPAAALFGYNGIDLARPDPRALVVRLDFAADEIVYASRGVLLSSPRPMLGFDAGPAGYAVVDAAQARELVSYMMAERLGAALRLLPPSETGPLAPIPFED